MEVISLGHYIGDSVKEQVHLTLFRDGKTTIQIKFRVLRGGGVGALGAERKIVQKR